MKQLLVLALLVLLPAACEGGAGSDRPAARSATTVVGKPEPAARAELERRLERTSVGICNGECRTYRASAATCSGDGTEIEGRTYYRCRVAYERRGGHAPAPDEFCAALDGVQGHLTRPLADCGGEP